MQVLKRIPIGNAIVALVVVLLVVLANVASRPVGDWLAGLAVVIVAMYTILSVIIYGFSRL